MEETIAAHLKEPTIHLTGLEIFFIVATVISLLYNAYQFMELRKFKQLMLNPIHSQIVGLFNDIKSKLTTIFLTQQLLTNPKSPHKDLETLRWEYYLFTFTIVGYLNGFQEIVRGVLATLKPEDKTGEAAFKAADYGLTEQERKIRDEYVKRYATQASNIPQTQEQTEEKTKT